MRSPRIDRFILLLIGAFALVASVPRVSDVRNQRIYEIHHILPFEHPVLARVLFVAIRHVWSTPTGMAIVTALVGVTAVGAVAWLLRRAGADAALWMGAPTLILAGQNVDAVTCVFIVLALQAWVRERDVEAGVWVGIGAAFKLTPALLLPALALAGGRRRAMRLGVPAAAVWAVCNVPYALTRPAAWRFPYRFAQLRDDLIGTVWAGLPFGRDTVNRLSSVLLVLGVVAVGVLVARRRVSGPTGVVLTFAAFLATNKVWQPHYLLWVLAAGAFAGLPRRQVRWLEAANLAYFAVYWLAVSPSTVAPFIWLTAIARLLCLGWLVVALVASDSMSPAQSPTITSP